MRYLPSLGLSRLLILFLLHLITPAAAAGRHRGDGCRRVYPNQSIQQAINNARSGDCIKVEAGTYYEQLTIQTNNIHLIGKKAILKPPSPFPGNFCSGLSQTLDGQSTEAGICIYGTNVALAPYIAEHRKVTSVGSPVTNVAVTGFTVSGFSGENIAVVGGKNVHASHNTLLDGGQYGFLSVGSTGTRAEGNTVSTSTLNFIAMCMDDYGDTVYANNIITGYFTGLCAQTPGGIYTKNSVSNACVGSAADPGVKGARIVDNYFNLRNPACDKNFKSYGAGVVVYGATETVVTRNTIERFHNGGVGVGIFLTNGPGGEVATNNTVWKNVLRNNDFDIFDNSTGKNDLEYNSCMIASVPPTACA